MPMELRTPRKPRVIALVTMPPVRYDRGMRFLGSAFLLVGVLLAGCGEELAEADWELHGGSFYAGGFEESHATAVGGTQHFRIRGPDWHNALELVARSERDVFEIEPDPNGDGFIARGLRAGTDRITVESATHRAQFEIDARQAVTLRAVPNLADRQEPAEIAERWQAFTNGMWLRIELRDEEGVQLVDESLTLVPPGGQTDWWDVQSWTVPAGEVLITAEGYPGLAQEALGVSSIDTIEVADAPQTLSVGEEAEVCLAASKDGDRVWGIPWDFETQGPLATVRQDNLSPSELLCAVLTGTGEGTGSLTVRVGEVEEVIDVVVVP